MNLHDFFTESVAGPEKCWPGHRKVGTKPGTGKNAGKRVNDCEKIEEQGVSEGLDNDESVLYHFAEVLADEIGYDADEVADSIVQEMTTPSGIEVYSFTDDNQTYYMGVLGQGRGSAIVSVSHAGGGQDNELEIYAPGEQLAYVVKYGRTGATLNTPNNKTIAQAKPGHDENDLVAVALDLMWGRMQHRFSEDASESKQLTKYRATVEYGPTAADAHFVTVSATSTDEAYKKVEAWCKKNRVANPMITINGADKPVAEGDVVQFPKKHRGDLEDTHDCPKCGGDLQGGTYMGHKVKVCMPCKQVYLPPNSGIDKQGNKIEEYGDTARGQKMLTKVQKRAVDRVTSKKADTDPKYAKKNSDTANRAWDRMTDKDLDEGANERKQNALWAQITAHEKAAKKSKDLKQQHHLKMAAQLRSQLKTSDNEVVAEGDDAATEFYVYIGSEDAGQWIGSIVKDGGKWREMGGEGTKPHNWGTTYMSYLSPDEVMQWIRQDYRRGYTVEGPFYSDAEVYDYAEQMGFDDDDVMEQGAAEGSAYQHHVVSKLDGNVLASYKTREEAQKNAHGNPVVSGSLETIGDRQYTREQGVAEGNRGYFDGMPTSDNDYFRVPGADAKPATSYQTPDTNTTQPSKPAKYSVGDVVPVYMGSAPGVATINPSQIVKGEIIEVDPSGHMYVYKVKLEDGKIAHVGDKRISVARSALKKQGVIEASSCAMTEEGVMCPVHGLHECSGSMMNEAVSGIELSEILFKGFEQKYPDLFQQLDRKELEDTIMDAVELAGDIDSMSDIDMMIDDIAAEFGDEVEPEEPEVPVLENKLYYNVIGTPDAQLRKDFGLRKDSRGWYLKEDVSIKRIMTAFRAFGEPTRL